MLIGVVVIAISCLITQDLLGTIFLIGHIDICLRPMTVCFSWTRRSNPVRTIRAVLTGFGRRGGVSEGYMTLYDRAWNA